MVGAFLVDESRFDLRPGEHFAGQHPQRCLAFFIGTNFQKESAANMCQASPEVPRWALTGQVESHAERVRMISQGVEIIGKR